MKKYFVVAFGIILLVPISLFSYRQLILIEAEKAFMEEYSQPKVQIGVWNKTDSSGIAEFNYENGEVKYAQIPEKGGVMASYPAGSLSVTVSLNNGSTHTVENINLGNGSVLQLEVTNETLLVSSRP